MKKTIGIILCCCWVASQAQITEEQSDLDSFLDSLFVVDTLSLINTPNSFLYASAQFDEQVYFSGRDFDIDQYGFAPSLTYMATEGLFVNLGALYYSGLEPAWDLMVASLGHYWHLNNEKSLNLQASYSHFFYADQQEGLNNSLFSSGLSYRKNRFGTGFGIGYLFGGETTYYITLRSDYSIKLAKWGEVELNLVPSLDLLFSQQNITEQVSLIQITERSVFDLINTQLSLPLEIDIGSFDIELSYNINMPKALPGETLLSNNGFLSIGVGYLLPV